jgi:ATP-dependent RNA helicase DeaD
MLGLAPDIAETIGPALLGALHKQGFTELTPVQLAVLDPELAGRDLRISSQTGSGKTVALGLLLRELAQRKTSREPTARPGILIVAPTRELARQVADELTWLYTPLRIKLATATGGASYRTERAALGAGPSVVVGTPGRLVDHLSRGVIDPSQIGAVVLDEADRMLEMGFREELDAILSGLPEQHQTHLVSATFPREVRALADRVQRDAVPVEGTRLGIANADIEHIVHLIDPEQRVDALINLLLANPEEQTLIFARTRADVANIADELARAGFSVDSLSGEMDQPARDRAMGAFRKGELRALVATDVAARGIDVLAIERVIHADPPTDADGYTHRSGRTGRAGRKGTSSVLVPVQLFRRTLQLLRMAGVTGRVEPIPSAAAIAAANDARLVAELTADDPEGFSGYDDRTWALARHLAQAGETTRLIARLLTRTRYAGETSARDVREIKPPAERKAPGARTAPERGRRDRDEGWVTFKISWGKVHGAETRRVLAVLCRRGEIESSDVGTIRVGPTTSSVEIRAGAADAFALAAARPDPRNPRVQIRREGGNAPARTRAPIAPRDEPQRERGGRKAARELSPRDPRGSKAPREQGGTKPPRRAAAGKRQP